MTGPALALGQGEHPFDMRTTLVTARIRVPELKNSRLVVRMAKNDKEIQAANWLVFRNYVAEGFWDNDLEAFHNNKWLHSSHRRVFVALDADQVIGTASLILDSKDGLPSDSFKPEWIRGFRSKDKLAEVSALSIDKSQRKEKNLVLFLMKYYMQYAFYYTDTDRLIKACKPEHADFYASILRFQKIEGITHNNYARRPSQLLSMHLLEGHSRLSEYYELGSNDKNNFYRFIFVDEHPNMIFPVKRLMRRSRTVDWPVFARGTGASMQFNPGIIHSREAHA